MKLKPNVLNEMTDAERIAILKILLGTMVVQYGFMYFMYRSMKAEAALHKAIADLNHKTVKSFAKHTDDLDVLNRVKADIEFDSIVFDFDL